MVSGCAKLPPSSTSNIALSGKRLVVKIQFSGNINPNYHYYFLINYDTKGDTGVAGSQVAGNPNPTVGPIPVLGPITIGDNRSYGNGFATSATGVGGFTDFVRFEGNAYRLFHVVGDPTLNQRFIDEGQPVAFTLPNAGRPNELSFEIDLAQLVVDAGGGPLDATTTVANANLIKYLQVNVVATDVVPTNQVQPIPKQVDSLGDDRTSTGAAAYLNLIVSDVRSWTNADFQGFASFEPSDIDVYPNINPDPSLDITQNYSIALTKQ